MKNIALTTLLENYSQLVELHSGPREAGFSGIQDPAQATATDIIFVEHQKYLPAALSSPAPIIVVNKALLPGIKNTSKTILVSRNVILLMARVLRDYFPVPELTERIGGFRIHPTAVIADSARIHDSAAIGPFAVIGERVHIGARSTVGGHCYVQTGTVIGDDCHLHPHVFIGPHCVIQNRVEIHPQSSIGTEGFGYAHDEMGRHERIRHQGRVILENDVHLGAGSHVDRGTLRDTVIGEGTKIDNLCHFGHNVRVGKHCLIAGGILMAGSSSIGNHVVIGGSVNISGHIHIADGVRIAGFSTLTKSVADKGDYQGYPLLPLPQHKRAMAALITLPELRKDVVRLIKKLNPKDS